MPGRKTAKAVDSAGRSDSLCASGRSSETARGPACEIRKAGAGLSLVYVSGIRCSPKAACTFSCTERGGTLTCRNSGGADDEGGRYASTLAFTVGAARPISGTGKSSYAGPMGISCEWRTSLTLTKPATRPEAR